MKTGISYMGHYNPRHIAIDLYEMNILKIDDVLVAIQENDFEHFMGKVRYTPKIAIDHGIRPINNSIVKQTQIYALSCIRSPDSCILCFGCGFGTL